MKTLLLLGIALLASCDKGPDAKAMRAALYELRRAEFEVVLTRGKADRPNATPAAGVDYHAALAKRERAEAAAIAAGANAMDLESHRQLGETEGRKLEDQFQKENAVFERQLRGY
jgi:hypothetical protein